MNLTLKSESVGIHVCQKASGV